MIKVQTPAKINLTLDIIGKRQDGFHNIESIMQAVSLYDYLTIEVQSGGQPCEISLSGNNNEIPYDENNLVYKAVKLFLESAEITNKKILINIEKNIPVAAGLAGGSSNASGALFGLNKIFDNPLSKEQIHDIASQLGSDLNFCIEGGTQLATSRGEILNKINTPKLDLIIVKPKDLGISAGYAYKKYASMAKKPELRNSQEMIENIDNVVKLSSLLNNNLETAIINDFPQINQMKKKLIDSGCLNSLMSGSGSTVFGILPAGKNVEVEFGNDYEVFRIGSVAHGVQIVQ